MAELCLGRHELTLFILSVEGYIMLKKLVIAGVMIVPAAAMAQISQNEIALKQQLAAAQERIGNLQQQLKMAILSRQCFPVQSRESQALSKPPAPK
jgi:hypothetical protein